MSGVSGTPNRRLKGGNRPPHMSQSKNLWMANTRHNNQLHSNAFEKVHFYQVCECIEHGVEGTFRTSLR